LELVYPAREKAYRELATSSWSGLTPSESKSQRDRQRPSTICEAGRTLIINWANGQVVEVIGLLEQVVKIKRIILLLYIFITLIKRGLGEVMFIYYTYDVQWSGCHWLVI
jgi:hypothetical protein